MANFRSRVIEEGGEKGVVVGCIIILAALAFLFFVSAFAAVQFVSSIKETRNITRDENLPRAPTLL